MKRLLLIDGSSYLYRAFHAMPDLRAPDGSPTGAIYGVINMLRRIQTDYNCDYIACVFDAKGPTFRDDLYPEYKATRAAMPDDLKLQTAPLKEAVIALGWPVISIEGVEADDVIGTLAERACAAGLSTIVSTGDKDMAQLVNECVTLINTMTNEKLDEAGVLAKFGVPATRIVDYLSLVGDTVDNVPGVEKCGPKTAVKWLNEYDSLDNLIAHAGEIKGVVGENLRRALPWLPTGRALVTIKRDVPLPFDFADLVPQAPNTARLRELYQRFGFKGFLKDLETGPAAAGASPAAEVSEEVVLRQCERQYETILTEEQLSTWIDRIAAAPLVALDTETTGLDPMRAELVGLSLAIGTDAAYLPLAHHYLGMPQQLDRVATLERLRPWLEDANRPKVGQNLKYDMHILANHGVILRGVRHDTMLESAVIEAHKPHDMDSLALRHLNYRTIPYTEVAGKGAKQRCFDEVDIDAATTYAAEDAEITLQLHEALYPQIEGDEKLARIYRDIEMPLLSVIFEIERTGVLIDAVMLATQSEELGRKMAAIEATAFELAGRSFNINSPKQLAEIFFDELKLPVKKKTPSGSPSTDEEVLQQLALDYPLPKLVLEYRGLSKLKSTYTDKLPRMIHPVTGRVHTSYAQVGAVTGRLASSEPNLQNIPVRTLEGRRIREAFIASPKHVIVAADYSQIELRIMAHLSGDEALLAAFRDGRDVHRATAGEIFGIPADAVGTDQRRIAKTINFGLIYGMSAFGLAAQLDLARAAAQSYIDRYFTRYPGVAAYMARTREAAREHGYVETILGRRLWLPEIRSSNAGRRQGAERAAINAPMQGTAADIVKLAMVRVAQWIRETGLQSRVIMQVHDELVLEVPEHELETVRAALPGLMCSVVRLDVPLEVEVGIGPSWEKAH